MGNYSRGVMLIRCIFAEYPYALYPAFANDVSAKSSLVNFNSGKVSAKGEVREISSSNTTPARLGYQVTVTPENDELATGTVKTGFSGDIMEVRLPNGSSYNGNKSAATNSWRDKTTVTGGIRELQKMMGYESVMRV
ncbi:MAG: hypothetical protein LUQ07_03740 [Methanospirillum sp.]|nr:hypothetical protein [Methanospirillum sp.]